MSRIVLPRCEGLFRCVLLVSLLIVGKSLCAQPRLTAVASEKEIGKNDYVEIQYAVENAVNVQQINPPVFRNFDIVSGPNQQSGISDVNGQVTRYIGIAYVLKPRSSGTFTIPGAIAKADGRELRSNPITIVVSNATSTGKSGGNSFSSPFSNFTFDEPAAPQAHDYDDYIIHKGDNLEEKIKKNIFVKVETNKTTCFVGEPIVATYKLYTRLKSESSLTKSPALNGFSVSELGNPRDNSMSTQKYSGREYSVYTLRKVQLYPLQAGNIELDPAEVDNKITFIKAEYASTQKGDIFYDMLRDFSDATTPPEALLQRTITLRSAPQIIVVKSLPEINKPPDFKGAVGDFKIQESLEKGNLTTDDAGALRVLIAGEGNLQMINAPKLTWPEGVEAFDPKLSENISKLSVPMRGEKVYSFPFIASKPGTYIVPGISFSYFDPAIQNYKVIHTKDFTINVTQGSGIKPVIIPSTAVASGSNESINKVYGSWWVFAGGGVICLLLAAWFISKGKKQDLSKKPDPINQIQPNENRNIPQNPFSDAEQFLTQGNSHGFYRSLQDAIRVYLSAKLQVPVDELTKKKINERLDKCNVGVGTTVMLCSLIDDIEMNLYAPFSSTDHMQTIYDRATEVVALVDKQIC